MLLVLHCLFFCKQNVFSFVKVKIFSIILSLSLSLPLSTAVVCFSFPSNFDSAITVVSGSHWYWNIVDSKMKFSFQKSSISQFGCDMYHDVVIKSSANGFTSFSISFIKQRIANKISDHNINYTICKCIKLRHVKRYIVYSMYYCVVLIAIPIYRVISTK